jgi:hypothetical protein
MTGDLPDERRRFLDCGDRRHVNDDLLNCAAGAMRRAGQADAVGIGD